MATIFLNDPNINDRCLILEPKEALVYPLPFNDWTEIRVSASISFTTSDSNSAVYLEETLPFNNTSQNGFYWGLKTSGASIPYQSGVYYFGAFTSGIGSATHNTFLRGTTTRFNVGRTDQYTIGFSSGNAFNTGLNAGFLNVSQSTGYSNQTLFGQAYRIYNKNTINQGISYAHTSSSANSGVSITGLRGVAASVNPNLNISIPTGETIPNLNQLNTLFIYCPLVTDRLRIHSLLVEKYE